MTRALKPILLVEDNADDLELAMRALTRHVSADRIAVARDGVQALAYLFGEADVSKPLLDPALVLLDVRLPRLGGLDVIRRLRSVPRTRLLPIVLLTSSAEPSDILDAYTAGANAYVRKPIAFERFVDTIDTITAFWLDVNVSPAAKRDGCA
jgi:two-component system, response regulator